MRPTIQMETEDNRPSIAELQRLVSSEDPDHDCARCHVHMHIPPDLDPSALCNACAQWVVSEATPLLLEIVAAALALRDQERVAAKARYRCKSMVEPSEMAQLCPYGGPGDRLVVIEKWRTEERASDLVDGIRFAADDARWTYDIAAGASFHARDPVAAYRKAWDHFNGTRRLREYLKPGERNYGRRQWRTVVDTSVRSEANPWVWALTFRREQ